MQTGFPINLDLASMIGKQPIDILTSPHRKAHELVTDMIIANKHVRQGTAPSGESLHMIETIVKNSVAHSEPIPMLTVHGCIKAGPVLNDRIDLAEVMGLHTLRLLEQRIVAVYPPGIDLTVRLEDLTEIFNVSYEHRNIDKLVGYYSKSYKRLAAAMGLSFAQVRCESEMVDAHDWQHWTHFHAGLFASYLAKTRSVANDKLARTAEYNDLTHMGWSGTIDHDTRTWFAARYKRIYGKLNQWDFEYRLAHYLAGIMTRIRFGASGVKLPAIYLSLSSPLPFVFPQPRVYYRTRAAHAHLAPWCAVGYVDMANADLKLVSARESEFLTWHNIDYNGASIWAPYQPANVVHY